MKIKSILPPPTEASLPILWLAVVFAGFAPVAALAVLPAAIRASFYPGMRLQAYVIGTVVGIGAVAWCFKPGAGMAVWLASGIVGGIATILNQSR